MRAGQPVSAPAIDQLVEKRQREEFVESLVKAGVPLQVRALRRRRGLTQKALAERAGTTSVRISQMEQPARHALRMDTLLKLAAALDVGLEVRFVEFGELIDRSQALDPDTFAVRSFDRELDDARRESPDK